MQPPWRYIVLTKTDQEIGNMASNYYETQGIPKCLGGVVGTHVAKKEPTSTGSSTAPF